MKNKRAKLKIVRLLITALLLCSFPSVKVYSSTQTNASVGFVPYDSTDNSIIGGSGVSFPIYVDSSSNAYFYSCTYDFSDLTNYSYTGYSVRDYDGLSWDVSVSSTSLTLYLSSESSITFDGGIQALVSVYFYPRPADVTPTPTITDTPTPTPTAQATYGTGSQACEIRWFQGSYPASNSGSFFYPSGSWSTGVRVMYPDINGQYSSGFFYPPAGYAIDVSQFPVSYGRMSVGITEGVVNKYAGTFSTNDDGSVIYFNNIRVDSVYQGDSNTAFVAVVPVTPTPTLSPTPTLTPYPSAAPPVFSTYTVNFVAPNGYIVGSIPFLLSVGSSYAGAISNLTFSFLDGWFSYGDEINGVKGSFTWDYSYSDTFDTYLWHFSTDSWPVSESINIPVYRLDGDYPEVVPDLNNVSDLFDTIGKTDPQNFSWFYDGLQAFIDVNWSWAYLMLLFPLFVMLWAFFRRH